MAQKDFLLLLSLNVLSLAFALPNNVDAQQIAKRTASGTGYLEYLPSDYQTNTTKTYPLLIFLHGSGETGTGSPGDLEKVKANGPPKLIQAGQNMCFTVNGVQECFIVISPQLATNAGGWWPSILQPIFDYLMNGPENYRIDKTRVYLTGLSLGGQGTYIGLGETTDIFAAGAVIAGFDNGNGCTISARKINVWGFHGESDGTIPYQNGVAAFNKIGLCTTPAPTAELKWTSYPGVGHNAWDNAYSTDHSVQSPLNVYEWLLSKSKNISGNISPIANAGFDQAISLPTNTLTIYGSGTDADGTISSYSWTKISGPAATLSNSTTSQLNLSALVSGTYVFRLSVKDNLGAIATDDMTVIVNPPTLSSNVNLALIRPVVTSSNESWAMPGSMAVDGNTGTRWGSQFSDPQWIYVDLGASFNIDRVKISWEKASAANFKIQLSIDATTWTDVKTITGNTNLINDYTGLTGIGRYVKILGTARTTPYGYSIYELEVYGNAVNTNIAPIANAGLDQMITLPTNSLTLVGSGTDSDGTISSYTWTKLSGPAAILNNINSSSLSLSALVSGSYIFRLSVVDNSGATATDEVTVLVNPLPVGLNLALLKPVVASSTEGWALSGANAVDGNASTRWSSQFSDSQWMYVDLGSAFNITRVKITWEFAKASNYKIQTSNDAVVWTDIKVIAGNTVSVNDYVGLVGAGRYVRMYGTSRTSSYGYSIYEFEVYGDPVAISARLNTGSDQTNASEVPIVDPPIFTFLDKTYIGKNYSVVIYNQTGIMLFNGEWKSDLYQEVFKDEELYLYRILQSGTLRDSGKFYITK